MKILKRVSLTLAGVVLLVLTGCAAQQPALDAATADALNGSVVAVATAAAGDDPAAALAQLDALQGQLDAAVASGAVSGARAADIQSSIDLMRLDLEALVALQPTPTPTPTPTDDDDKPDKPGRGNKDDD